MPRGWIPSFLSLVCSKGSSPPGRPQEVPVKSENRFLTTHVGSLPRPDDLIEIMFAREDGVPIDRVALAERIELAVDEAVARQVEAGVDVVNDGEWPKPSYATYIKDRLNGFGGAGNAFVFQDIEDFPRTKARVFADPGRKHRKTPACNSAVSVKDVEARSGGAVHERGFARRDWIFLRQRLLSNP